MEPSALSAHVPRGQPLFPIGSHRDRRSGSRGSQLVPTWALARCEKELVGPHNLDVPHLGAMFHRCDLPSTPQFDGQMQEGQADHDGDDVFLEDVRNGAGLKTGRLGELRTPEAPHPIAATLLPYNRRRVIPANISRGSISSSGVESFLRAVHRRRPCPGPVGGAASIPRNDLRWGGDLLPLEEPMTTAEAVWFEKMIEHDRSGHIKRRDDAKHRFETKEYAAMVVKAQLKLKRQRHDGFLKAALKIQAWWRSHRGSFFMKVFRTSVNRNVQTLQNRYRACVDSAFVIKKLQEQKRFRLELLKAATVLQVFWRRYLARSKLKHLVFEALAEREKILLKKKWMETTVMDNFAIAGGPVDEQFHSFISLYLRDLLRHLQGIAADDEDIKYWEQRFLRSKGNDEELAKRIIDYYESVVKLLRVKGGRLDEILKLQGIVKRVKHEIRERQKRDEEESQRQREENELFRAKYELMRMESHLYRQNRGAVTIQSAWRGRLWRKRRNEEEARKVVSMLARSNKRVDFNHINHTASESSQLKTAIRQKREAFYSAYSDYSNGNYGIAKKHPAQVALEMAREESSFLEKEFQEALASMEQHERLLTLRIEEVRAARSIAAYECAYCKLQKTKVVNLVHVLAIVCQSTMGRVKRDPAFDDALWNIQEALIEVAHIHPQLQEMASYLVCWIAHQHQERPTNEFLGQLEIFQDRTRKEELARLQREVEREQDDIQVIEAARHRLEGELGRKFTHLSVEDLQHERKKAELIVKERNFKKAAETVSRSSEREYHSGRTSEERRLLAQSWMREKQEREDEGRRLAVLRMLEDADEERRLKEEERNRSYMEEGRSTRIDEQVKKGVKVALPSQVERDARWEELKGSMGERVKWEVSSKRYNN